MDAEVLRDFHRATNTAPALPAEEHKCKASCKLWEHRRLRAFVCKESRKIHWCGERCNCRVTTVADEVCAMTGLVLGRAPEMYQPIYSKSRNRVVQRLHNRPTRQSAISAKTERVRRWVSHAVDALLTSPQRASLKASHEGRAVEKAIRALRGDVTFTKVHTAVALVCIRAGPSLQPPAAPNSFTIRALKTELTKYAVSFPGLKHTERGVTAFTAACLQRLATGMEVDGIVLFKKSPFVAAHVPAEISHNELCNIPCRQVSAAHRLLITQLVGPAGLPCVERAFP